MCFRFWGDLRGFSGESGETPAGAQNGQFGAHLAGNEEGFPAGDLSSFEEDASIAFVWTSANADARLPQVFRAEAQTHFQETEGDFMRKDTTFSIRISKEDLELIKQNAKKARMSQSDYVTHCCLGRQIVVIEGLKELAKELRAIGNNLNQLTALANMKQITVVYLDKVAEGLADISAAVRALQEYRRM